MISSSHAPAASILRYGKVRFANIPQRRLSWSVVFLLSYLAGITIIGKGPTYIGVSPLYWGEVVMIVSALFIAPLIKGTDLISKTSTLTTPIVLLMVLGTALTITSFPRWGLDAIRDAAMWYYAVFFFVGLGLASRSDTGDRVWSILRVFWLLSLIWNTANLLSGQRISQSGPILSQRGLPLFFNSTHEAGQNLALGAILILCTDVLKSKAALKILMVAIAVLGMALFAIQDGRGMRVGIASGVLAVLLLSFSSRKPRLTSRLLVLMVLAIPLVVFAAMADSERFMKLANLDRFEETGEGTAAWRTIWWQRLYEAVMKTNPAFGLGFGESLAMYHPLLENLKEDNLVRSPHNFNITVFARMGIVGLLLWLGVLILGIGGLFVRVWRGVDKFGNPYNSERKEELTFWILMLVCTVVNSSLGVMMEGPVLGIWFWFALGFATTRALNSGATSIAINHRFRIRLRKQTSTPVPVSLNSFALLIKQ